ncbi:hypothetical protein AB0O68_15610 [Streptomyces sp. NPDC087512]|uniref:hypothetical protein n=1 Tax=Streptomyces sp. NPDC087512 TaxID=3155059 RepID=UPI00343971B4
MTHGTDTVDPREAPDGNTAPPSYAAQILIVAARALRLHDSLGAVTPWTVHDVLDTGEKAILTTLPDAVRADARARARAALPQIPRNITRGEYALRLDAAAMGL